MTTDSILPPCHPAPFLRAWRRCRCQRIAGLVSESLPSGSASESRGAVTEGRSRFRVPVATRVTVPAAAARYTGQDGRRAHAASQSQPHVRLLRQGPPTPSRRGRPLATSGPLACVPAGAPSQRIPGPGPSAPG